MPKNTRMLCYISGNIFQYASQQVFRLFCPTILSRRCVGVTTGVPSVQSPEVCPNCMQTVCKSVHFVRVAAVSTSKKINYAIWAKPK